MEESRILIMHAIWIHPLDGASAAMGKENGNYVMFRGDNIKNGAKRSGKRQNLRPGGPGIFRGGARIF